MKILYISNGSNFSGAGGMEYHLIDITNWLQGKGVETALALRKDTFILRNLLRDKPNVYPLSWTGINKVFSFIDVAKAIRHFSPDIVSINRERDIVRIFFIVKLMGLFLKKKPKIVAVFHNVGWKRSSVLERLDGVIFPNNYLKQEYLPRNGSAAIRSSVIYHGIDLPNIDPGEKVNPHRERRYFKGAGYPIIGMVGELRKNQAELIDVAYYLKRKLSHFIIALVGRGTDAEVKSIQKKIDRRGVSKNVILTGNVDRSYIPDIFYDLDLSVTTNRYEPFGIVFIESLASYTPLIAYNSGGPVEILEKGGGILVEGGPAEMAEQIFMLISDHEKRKTFGMKGREAAERFYSIDAMGKKHFNFYRDILHDSGKP